MRDTILRRIGRSSATGHLKAFETVGLASAATLCSAIWVGIAVPSLSVLPASNAAGRLNVSISLESALLGIDDGSGRKVAVGTLADRVGIRSSRPLLPSLERLRAAARDLGSQDSGAPRDLVQGARALAVDLHSQLLSETAAPADASAPATASDKQAQIVPATVSTPVSSPPPERAPAPAPVTASALLQRGGAPAGGKTPAGAGAPPASNGGKSSGKPAAPTEGDSAGQAADPAVTVGGGASNGSGATPAYDEGEAVVPTPPDQPSGAGADSQPNGNGQVDGSASGQADGNATGPANGNANGNGQANGQANGNANGQADGNANASGQANGNANGQANGNANGNGQSGTHGNGNPGH